MAKGYWIANVDLIDMEAMQRYRAANSAVLARHGAKFLVAGGTQRNMDGEPRSRFTVVEFPTYEAALAAYDDPEYQEASKHRKVATSGISAIVEGFEMPPANPVS